MTDIKTFATRHPGTVLRVALATRNISTVGNGQPIANFDGILRVNDHYFATDWTGGRLLKISPRGEVQTVLSGFWPMADLGYSRENSTLAIPIMSENRLIFVHLNSFK